MQSLKENVHIEDKYTGVTLGVLNLPHGLIYIDAPPIPEDGRSWRADLIDLDSGYERMLINLDENIDRTIGSRAMDCPVLAHKKTAEFFSNRSNTFKAQGQSTGATWETIPSLGNIRWAPPQITLSKKITLHWGKTPIILEHHPSTNKGAIWLILPEEKIVFVGDLILKNQPPFFANADLPLWLEDLALLSSDAYQGFTVVSGRGGVCASSTIEKQSEIIEGAHKKLEALAKKNAEVEKTEKMIPDLLSPLRFPVSEREIFTQRLRYGLKEYYQNHYQNDEEE
ncbi:MAG: hypothetical protein HN390_16395 [Anaerolineae bacterium]|jgi:cyclase|nr:hypothetical protein [Anaerolineae bacterium]MBT7191538.1 hypothetical protein [Anaerolineae bacterium]MBT7988498.1 hypothetical protein [Anaerolineae bacterium]